MNNNNQTQKIRAGDTVTFVANGKKTKGIVYGVSSNGRCLFVRSKIFRLVNASDCEIIAKGEGQTEEMKSKIRGMGLQHYIEIEGGENESPPPPPRQKETKAAELPWWSRY